LVIGFALSGKVFGAPGRLRGLKSHGNFGEMLNCHDQKPYSTTKEGVDTFYIKTTKNGKCTDKIWGGSLRLMDDGYVCGRCPQSSDDMRLLKCPNQQPFSTDKGIPTFYIKNTENGKCTDKIWGGAMFLMDKGFECGKCPGTSTAPNSSDMEMLKCPNQQPYSTKGVISTYWIKKTESDGSCTDQIWGGATQYTPKGYVCGRCEQPKCPNQETCFISDKMEKMGMLSYNVYKRDANGMCTEACEAGDRLKMRLNSGFKCGKCKNN